MKEPTFKDIKDAQKVLEGVIIKTPTLYSPYLSRLFKAEIYLKLENFQETGSFKERGAYIKLHSLAKSALAKGVITVSAGNHAQAVALHAYKMKIPATIVMPVYTPPTKVANTERWGAKIILAGSTLEEAYKISEELAASEGLSFIHPYDDPEVIAGQGTIGIEMLEAQPDLDVILVPIGGGGLCSGIAIAAKAMKPSIKIFGVEVQGYASMARAIYGFDEVKLGATTLAEGIGVKAPGLLPQPILKEYLSDIIVVSEEQIEKAVDLFVRKQNTVVEGAGAVGLAALLSSPAKFEDRKIGIVVSGGNIDARLITSIIMRGQIREGRFNLLRIKINDVPGVLAKISGIIATGQGNIIEVKHERLMYEIPIKMAELDIMVETRNLEHIESIIHDLKEAGFEVVLREK
jgi:threonine dehydratase